MTKNLWFSLIEGIFFITNRLAQNWSQFQILTDWLSQPGTEQTDLLLNISVGRSIKNSFSGLFTTITLHKKERGRLDKLDRYF